MEPNTCGWLIAAAGVVVVVVCVSTVLTFSFVVKTLQRTTLESTQLCVLIHCIMMV